MTLRSWFVVTDKVAVNDQLLRDNGDKLASNIGLEIIVKQTRTTLTLLDVVISSLSFSSTMSEKTFSMAGAIVNSSILYAASD